ncbi:MAG: OmpA family protein [Alphaproteobacteria bacterium]
MFFATAATAFAAGRGFLILPAAVVLFAAGAASAQDTVYIGGSGQTSVAIDLGALDRFVAPRRVGDGLRHPGVVVGGLAPVTLRRPGDAPAADTARTEAPAPQPAPVEPAPVEMVTKLETPPATVTTTPKLVAPEPMPAPEPTAAPEPAPEDMTQEELAAAKARNKNMVSSTSFANEAARAATNEAAAAEAKPARAQKAEPAAKAEPTGAQKAAPETEMAALGPAAAPTLPGESMQIIFAAGEAALPAAAKAPLATLAAALGRDETLRLQLRAYAGGGDESASQARRLSLSRALAVRSELIEQGVRSTRIDVRALGNKSQNGTSDRVDVILVQR